MDWLSTLVGETRMRLLRLVRGASRSIGELAPALGISENAVRGHIAAAERDGLVRQTAHRRPSGGKPARLYELTPEAEELFPKAYAQAFSELVRMLREEDGDEAAIDRLRRVGRRLGARAAASAGGSATLAGASIASRVATAAAVLESSGGSVEVFEDAAGWTLRSDGCPLSGVVTRDPDVCALAESLVAEVTGRPVVETCRRNGRPLCAFHVAR
jgi:predicted ArsR family transcriptional regulator